MDEGMAERDQLYQRAEKLSAMLASAAEDLTGAVADVNAGELLLMLKAQHMLSFQDY